MRLMIGPKERLPGLDSHLSNLCCIHTGILVGPFHCVCQSPYSTRGNSGTSQQQQRKHAVTRGNKETQKYRYIEFHAHCNAGPQKPRHRLSIQALVPHTLLSRCHALTRWEKARYSDRLKEKKPALSVLPQRTVTVTEDIYSELLQQTATANCYSPQRIDTADRYSG